MSYIKDQIEQNKKELLEPRKITGGCFAEANTVFQNGNYVVGPNGENRADINGPTLYHNKKKEEDWVKKQSQQDFLIDDWARHSDKWLQGENKPFIFENPLESLLKENN